MKFDRPVGAAADVRELEYVCALHQTQDDANWQDGSIEPIDVVYFLRSRYGIFTDEEEVKKVIFKGLAGGEGDDDCLDMMEMVAVLIIPLLLKVSKIAPKSEKTRDDFNSKRSYAEFVRLQERKKELEPPPRIIADVLHDILTDSEFYDDATGKHVNPKITPAVVRKIFGVYDELELIADNDLVDEMVAMASGGDPNAVLDKEAFTRALTDDVKLYNPNNEDKASTDFYDVFGTDSRNNELRKAKDEKVESDVDVHQVDTRMTLGNIDFTADNIRSTIHTILMWIVLIVSYLNYVYGLGEKKVACTMETPNFGCKVANSVCNWLQEMIVIITLGTTIATCLSFGNSILNNNKSGPVIGIAAVVIFVFFPLGFSIDAFYFKTGGFADDGGEGFFALIYHLFFWINLVSGVFLILIQIQNLIGLFVPPETLAKNGFLAQLVLGDNMKAAFRMKQAASYKVNKLVRNAYDLHEQNDEANERRDIKKNLLGEKMTKSTQEIALLNYTKVVEDTEEYGGLFWGWKKYLTGSIQSEEGIWLHSRLIASNAVQFTISFVLLVLFSWVASFVNTGLSSTELFLSGEDFTVYHESCEPTFDTSNCYLPFGPRVYTGVGLCIMDELPSECTNSDGVLRPVEGNSVADREHCTNANSVFEGYAYSRLAWAEILSLRPDYYSVVEYTENSIMAEYSNSTEVLHEYIDCKAYIVCRDDYPQDDISGYDPCSRFYSSDCTNLEETIDEQVFAFGEAEFGYNQSVVTDILDWVGSIAYYVLITDFCSGFSVYSPDVSVAASVTNSSCNTVISYCLYGEIFKSVSSPGLNVSLCLLGINFETLLPFQWRGDDCATDPNLEPMLEYYETRVKPHVTTAEDMLPDNWVISVTFGVAITVGLLASFSMSMVYIPSAIHTILKFRSGVIPSLKDPYFIKYRKALHLTTFMIGAMFWGLVFTTTMLVFLIAGVLFLVLWHVSRPYLYDLFALIIGIATTVVLKIVVCIYIGKASFAGLYRKRPILSNTFSFALECWHLALTVLSFIMRLAKFLAMTGIYVGRIDRPILQNDLMVDLDSMPRAFRQDMLLAEAHHHPYLERLGLMYMMKLRYGENFSTTAGATWRLLFVTALMPWLRKHRIQDEKFDLNCDALQDKLKETREAIVSESGREIIHQTTTDGEEIEVSPSKIIKSDDVGFRQVDG